MASLSFRLVVTEQTDNFFDAPDVTRDPRFRRWRHAERLIRGRR